MPIPTDERQEDILNPGQQDYDRRFNDIAQAEERGTFNDIANNYDQTADSSQEDANIRKLQDNEASSAPYSGWNNNVKSPGKAIAKAWWKKKGPIAGIGGGVGIVGVVLSLLGLGGTSLLLPNLAQNSIIQNDSRSTILERRLVQALNQKMGNNGQCVSTKMSCKMNKVPKSMLAAMESKGIRPLNASGSPIPIEGNGYMDVNPSQYSFTDADGKTKTISAAEFMVTYRENPTFRKAFKSAYNMRFLGYNGKYMLTNFFKKFSLKRDGGVAADPNLNEAAAAEKLDNLLKPSPETSAGEGAKRTITERIKTLFERNTNKLKKAGGDPILATGTIGCMAINTPRLIGGAWRAIQLSQILILVNDVILSPAGMQQAGKADGAKIAALGNLLTEKPKMDDGTFGKSALDSKILQSAMGVNKNKVSISRYAPGFSILTNPVVRKSSSLSASTKQACNLINSPQAMVASAGITAAIGTATAGTGLVVAAFARGVGGALATLGAYEAVMWAVEETGVLDAVGEVAYDVAKDHIPNYIEGARGEELGDALGVGLLSYFSQAGSASGAAPLTTDQAAGFAEVMASVDNDYQEEAIATLSPFDISSRYTFLGSIVSQLSLSSAQANPLLSGASMIGAILRAPFNKISAPVSAIENAAVACSYADDFEVESNIAINASGYPCVGIPTDYINMPRETVLSLVADEINDETGEIKPDGKIAEMMSDCSDADLESVSGCAIGGLAEVSEADNRLRAAQSLYMFDLQVENMLAGQDDEDSVSSEPATAPGGVSTGRPENTIDRNKGWSLKEGVDYSAAACAPGTEDAGTYTHPTEGFIFRKCNYQGKPVSSLVSSAVISMVEAAKADGVTLLIGNSFRSYEEQQALRARNCRGNSCNPPTATPGNSQHERGLAIDFAACSTRSTACYQWLAKNAVTYGYYNLESEPWHWSVSGN